MATIIRKIVWFVRVAVIVFAALTLVLNGAASAQRLFSNPCQGDEAEESVIQPSQLVPGPSPEHQEENVNPPGRPNSEPAAWVSSPVSVESDNSQSKIRFISGDACEEVFFVSARIGKGSLIGSTSIVSTFLGGQFTLVGAKPSGTS